MHRIGNDDRDDAFVGMDFDGPDLDMQGIAEGFGARGKDRKSRDRRRGCRPPAAHPGPTFLIIDREP